MQIARLESYVLSICPQLPMMTCMTSIRNIAMGHTMISMHHNTSQDQKKTKVEISVTRKVIVVRRI